MEIHNPKRILLLSLTPTTNPHPILQHLTSTSTSISPSQTQPQIQEPTTHHIQNPYFSAHIPIWSDTLPLDPSSWISDWKCPASSSPTAGEAVEIREVINAIGAWVCVFQHPPLGDELGWEDVASRLRCVADVIEGVGKGVGDGPVLVAVGVGTRVDGDVVGDGDGDWEEVCWDSGRWEYLDANLVGGGVQGQGQGQGERDGFGELMGLARLRQVLETADWEAEVDLEVGELEDILEEDENEDDEDEDDLQAEMQRVLALGEHGMKEPILGLSNPDEEEEEEEEVEDLQHMFLKLQAARDLGTSLPSSARRKLAARTVAEIMSK